MPAAASAPEPTSLEQKLGMSDCYDSEEGIASPASHPGGCNADSEISTIIYKQGICVNFFQVHSLNYVYD